jgi:hypothetical protein
VFYEEVMFSCSGRIIRNFALIYPIASKAMFDPDSAGGGTAELGRRGSDRQRILLRGTGRARPGVGCSTVASFGQGAPGANS